MIDLKGQTFGRLVVLQQFGRARNGSIMWECFCECGNVHWVNSGNLRSGHTRSCGCLHLDTVRLSRGEAAFNGLFYHRKKDAKYRSIKWKLTKQEFRRITKQNCFYCGVKPYAEASGTRINGNYRYNGVDRIDSTKGYTKDNVVPCCKQCNHAKSDYSKQEFLDWIENVYVRILA